MRPLGGEGRTSSMAWISATRGIRASGLRNIHKQIRGDSMRLGVFSGKTKMEQLCDQCRRIVNEPSRQRIPTWIVDRNGHRFCNLGCAFLFYQVHVVPAHCFSCGGLFQPTTDGTFSHVDGRMNHFCSNACVSRRYGFEEVQ